MPLKLCEKTASQKTSSTHNLHIHLGIRKTRLFQRHHEEDPTLVTSQQTEHFKGVVYFSPWSKAFAAIAPCTPAAS